MPTLHIQLEICQKPDLVPSENLSLELVFYVILLRYEGLFDLVIWGHPMELWIAKCSPYCRCDRSHSAIFHEPAAKAFLKNKLIITDRNE